MLSSKRATVLLAGIAALTLSLAAQTPEKFKTRLHPVPLDAALRSEITGNGSIAAALEGRKLSITGSFEGMRSPATIAQIRESPVTGVPGPAVLDLTVSKAASGSVTGSFELTGEQVEMLRKGRLYVQIHSENAPDGNLWGWLLR